LKQNTSNLDFWTYSPVPFDKMILNFANGMAVIFKIYSIDGYINGSEDDFKWSHKMDFNIYLQNKYDIRIISNTYPQNGKVFWQRSISGRSLYDSQIMNINISHTGNIEYEIGTGYAFYTK
jgi:hypothetical protein